MTTLDLTLAADANGYSAPQKEKSVTQRLGSDLFAKALERSQDEQSVAEEAAYAVGTPPPPPSEDSTSMPARGSQDVHVVAASTSRDRSTEAAAEEPVADAAPAEAIDDEAVDASGDGSGDEIELAADEGVLELGAEAVEEQAEEAALESAEPSLESASGEGEDGQLSDSSMESGDDAGMSIDDLAELAESEFEMSVESSGEAPVEELQVSQPLVQTEPTPAATPTEARAPVSINDSWGRQAFLRATRTEGSALSGPAPSSASDRVDAIAEEIAKARGSMSGARARLVIGEGAERVSLNIQLRNGQVHVDARSADAALANELAQESDALAQALEQHGLSLGDMRSGAGGGEGEQAELGAGDSAQVDERATDEPTRARLPKRGVRVVA